MSKDPIKIHSVLTSMRSPSRTIRTCTILLLFCFCGEAVRRWIRHFSLARSLNVTMSIIASRLVNRIDGLMTCIGIQRWRFVAKRTLSTTAAIPNTVPYRVTSAFSQRFLTGMASLVAQWWGLSDDDTATNLLLPKLGSLAFSPSASHVTSPSLILLQFKLWGQCSTA